MTLRGLMKDLAGSPAVKVARSTWDRAIEDAFEETEQHDLGLGHGLRLGKLDGQLVAVEEATDLHLAVRRLRSKKEGRELVAKRQDAYECMWDG